MLVCSQVRHQQLQTILRPVSFQSRCYNDNHVQDPSRGLCLDVCRAVPSPAIGTIATTYIIQAGLVKSETYFPNYITNMALLSTHSGQQSSSCQHCRRDGPSATFRRSFQPALEQGLRLTRHLQSGGRYVRSCWIPRL